MASTCEPGIARASGQGARIPDEVTDLLKRGWISCEAGRAAYLAAFHAAQALISERTGRIARKHAGVRSQFNLLTKDDPRVDPQLRRFLSDGFNLKTVADYEVGPDAVISEQDAKAAIDKAARLIDCIAEILAE
jgi:uncharacterized protein (UPF0332 family)